MIARIPTARGRRKTSLPDPTPSQELCGLANIVENMTGSMLHSIREQMNTPSLLSFKPDPWDEAIKSIEARHAREAALKEEWPWPSR